MVLVFHDVASDQISNVWQLNHSSLIPLPLVVYCWLPADVFRCVF